MTISETSKNITFIAPVSSSFGFMTCEKSAVRDSLMSIIEDCTFIHLANQGEVVVIHNNENINKVIR